MIRLDQVPMELDAALDPARQQEALMAAVCRKLGWSIGHPDLLGVRLRKRAVDARRGHPVRFSCTVDAELTPAQERQVLAEGRAQPVRGEDYRDPVRIAAPESSGRRRVVIVGTGPCGLFAGLQLARA